MNGFIQWLLALFRGSLDPIAEPPIFSDPVNAGDEVLVEPEQALAWGKRVSREFRLKVIDISLSIGIPPNWLMACMAFETGRTFDPAIRNAAGSGATGLIQFMPSTAAALGTSTNELASFTAVQQLTYVDKYFKPWRGKLHSLSDVYLAILWPRAVGKPEDYVLWRKDDPRTPKAYIQNAGLDFDKDGVVTKSEAANKVHAMLMQGLKPENLG